MATEADSDRVDTISRPGTRSSFIAFVGLVLLGLPLLTLVIFLNQRDRDESESPNTDVTVSDIANNPSEFYGKSVTVSGEIDDVMSRGAFVLGGKDFIGGSEVLVITAHALPGSGGRTKDAPAHENDLLQATGTVRPFDLAAVEKELSIDLNDAVFDAWSGKPVVVARSLNLTPRVKAVTEQGITVSLNEVVDNSSDYYGRVVIVSGEISDVMGSRAFAIGGGEFVGDPKILVVSAGALPSVADRPPEALALENDILQVTGQVQAFDLSAVENAIGYDLEDALFADWVGRPVIIASSMNLTPRLPTPAPEASTGIIEAWRRTP